MGATAFHCSRSTVIGQVLCCMPWVANAELMTGVTSLQLAILIHNLDEQLDTQLDISWIYMLKGQQKQSGRTSGHLAEGCAMPDLVDPKFDF